MAATQMIASVNIIAKLSSVNENFYFTSLFSFLGDISVSRKTIPKLLKTSMNSNNGRLKSFPDSEVDLWDQNIVNGQYVIAYEMNGGLDPDFIDMLPKVSYCFKC